MNEDIDREILSELRNLRKVNQRAFWFNVVSIVVLLLFCGYALWRMARLRAASSRRQDFVQAVEKADSSRGTAQRKEEEPSSWSDIAAALDRGDNAKALAIAKLMVSRQPKYHYSHSCLGSVYIALADFTNAETAFRTCYELYPCEENEKSLAAVRKRLANDLKVGSTVK